MGLTFTATTKSADIPEIEDGVYPADFDGCAQESHPDWAGKNKFGGMDDGERIRWDFTLFDQGDPVPVNVLYNLNFNTASKTVPGNIKILKALQSKAEYAAFEAGGDLDADTLQGRRCQVQIEHNDKGWPKIVAVLPAAKTAR